MTTKPKIRDLRDMTLDQLASDEEAARLVARLMGDQDEAQPLQVAAFQSYIGDGSSDG